jgi:hypothetical protein
MAGDCHENCSTMLVAEAGEAHSPTNIAARVAPWQQRKKFDLFDVPFI